MRARRDPQRDDDRRSSRFRSSPAARTTSLRRREDGERLYDAQDPLRARLCHQRRRASSTSARNISATAMRASSGAGSKAFRFGSSRSGPKAPRPAATRRRLRTLWRSASSEGHKHRRNARARKSRPFPAPCAARHDLAAADRPRACDRRHGCRAHADAAGLSPGRDGPHHLRPCAVGLARNGGMGRNRGRVCEPAGVAASARRDRRAGRRRPPARRLPRSVCSPVRSGAVRRGAHGGNGTGG